MIFIDTNVFYSVLVKTEFSLAARNIIMMPSKLATSATVLNELVFISLRKLCKERYGQKAIQNSEGSSPEKAMSPSKRIWT